MPVKAIVQEQEQEQGKTNKNRRLVMGPVVGLKAKVYNNPYANTGFMFEGEVKQVISTWYIGKEKFYRAYIQIEGEENMRLCVFPFKNVVKPKGKKAKFKYGVS